MPEPIRTHGSSTQDPSIWWQGVETVLHKLLDRVPPQAIRSIAVDGTSGTLLLTDPDGNPLQPARMYDDAKSIRESELIAGLAPDASVAHSRTSSLAKLLRMTKSRSPVGPFLALHQADWISGRLTGHYGNSDINNVLKLGYDVRRGGWPDWFKDLPIDPDCLPQVLPVGAVIGRISPEMARHFGLRADTLVCAGTTDSTASVIATGADFPGDAVTVLGSTLVTKVISIEPIDDPGSGVYSHRYGDQWLVGGASNSGGAVLKRYFSTDQLQQMETDLNPETPTGLDYYPLLRPGERFPVNDPDLEPRLHPRPDSDTIFLQGLLEGMGAIEAAAYQRLETLGCPRPHRVLTIGGGARNVAWQRIRERMLGIPVEQAKHQEAAYGSAIIARRGYAAL